MQRFFVCSFIFCFFVFTGCASFGEKHFRIRRDFEYGNFEQAKVELDKALKKKNPKEADVLKLNKAILQLCSGKAKEAETILREVRDKFDILEQKSINDAAEKTLSLLGDDNAVSYAGEDYEKVLIRVFLTLSNLMYDGTDAPAYALQIGQKQDDIVKHGVLKNSKDSKTLNPKAEAYKKVAVGQYLIGAMREETRRDNDDAVRAYQAVCQWEPSFTQAVKDLQRAKTGVPCQAGNGVVYVFGLVGAGPFKLQQNCEAGQAAQLYASLFLNMMSQKRTVPLGIAPVMIPCVVRPRSIVPSLNVAVDGRVLGQTETLMDIGKMAEEQFEAVKPQIIARAMIRRAMKKAIAVGAQEAVNSNQWVGLAIAAAEVVWEGTERADTRCWSTLPAEIQVVRLELPAGEHNINLLPSSRVFSLAKNGYVVSADSISAGTAATKRIRVEAGRNTYVLANFPNQTLAGEIIVSNELR